MKNRRVPLIIGIVLALGTGVLLLTYLMSFRPNTTATLTRAVLVANHDIPARAAATSDLFSLQQRTVSQLDSDAISDPKALEGKYTLVQIPAGSVATDSKIGIASAATLPAKLKLGMLAVSISLDSVKGVAGLITPGDRVDVIAVPPRAGNETPRGYAILRGALVLAMGSDVQTTTAAAPGLLAGPAETPSTVTLAVTPAQADVLAGADLNTSLRLALRNPNEPIAAFAPEPLQLAPQATQPRATESQPVQTFAAQFPPAFAPSNPPPTEAGPAPVTVIDGDKVTSGEATPR